MQTQSFIADPYADEQAQIKQNLAYAQQLQAQGLQPLEGQMVSNRFVAPSPVQGLANILKSYMGRKGQENAMRMDASLTNRKIADQTGEMARILAEPDIAARAALAGQSRLPGIQAMLPTFMAEQLKSARLKEKLGMEPPTVIQVTEGNQTVSKQWDPTTRTLAEIGRGDRFQPETAPASVKTYKAVHPEDTTLAGFDAWQRSNKAAGAAQISTYGSPVAAVDSAGNPVFIQPDNRGGEPRVLKDVKPAPKTNLMPKEVQTAKTKIMDAQNLKRQIAIAREKFNAAKQSSFTTGPVAGYNPISKTGQMFDAAIDDLRGTVTAITRVPGVGSMSDWEGKLDQAKLPNRRQYDDVTEQKLDAMDALADGMISGYGDMLGDLTPRQQPASDNGTSVLDQADAILNRTSPASRGGK